MTGSDIGYQMGGDGSLYWVGTSALFKHAPEGWKVVFPFPEDFMARRRNTAIPRSGLVVLPDNRIALFGGKDAFIQVLELKDPDEKDPPKMVRTIGYDSLGCTADHYPSGTGPQFCVSAGQLYFYLKKTGHFFRLNLESWSLTDYDVPWMAQEFSKPSSAPIQWKHANGGKYIFQPVVPESMSFAVEWDGSVHVAALMFNMPIAALHYFSVSSEGSVIHSETKTDRDLPDPNTYQNSTGDFDPIRSAIEQYHATARPAQNEEDRPQPAPAPHVVSGQSPDTAPTPPTN